jgi:putative phosphoserine phosphatase/1-acylglycerol-3-phosphate O-acyltransferase
VTQDAASAAPSNGQRQSRTVAFFDLDHGVLVKSAPDLLSQHLVSPGREVADRLHRFADRLSGPLTSPMAGRMLARSLKGTTVEALRHAGYAAAKEAELAPHARPVIDEHRAAGRRVIATTQMPGYAAGPLAEGLHFDSVIATRYSERDGVLDGELEGPFVWGRGKLEALRAWASDHGASLRRSYYYGGANSDAAVLAEVGRPVVVDPDPRLAAIAWLKGWPTRSLRAPAGVARIFGREIQEWMRPFARPELLANARLEFQDLEHIPDEGPAIVVGNHRSYYDGVAVGMAIQKAGRVARFLGKKEVFDAPIVGAGARLMGGIRVERGTGSDEPLHEAANALEAGEVIMLMPEGTIPRGPAFFEPELKGRWGAARLAAMTKAPVIPLGLWGTEKVWPRNARLPNMNPLNRPLVTVKAGPPVPLAYGDPDADTKTIMSAIVDLLPEEAKVQKIPTAEELARTYPPGYKGDPTKEVARRPGTDT